LLASFTAAAVISDVKGIIQPCTKEGDKEGVPIDRLRLPTQSPMFLDTLKGLLSFFKCHKNGYSI
jgi:hypothetical protein